MQTARKPLTLDRAYDREAVTAYLTTHWPTSCLCRPAQSKRCPSMDGVADSPDDDFGDDERAEWDDCGMRIEDLR